MLIYFFLTGGLLLGWSLGANDAVNIFGSAVNSSLVKFKTAAIVASIFIILGAILQGAGTTKTLSELGSVDTLGGAFMITLSTAIVVLTMTKFRFPVSTGQAIVGAIIGWCYFTSNQFDYTVLGQIVGVWVVAPLLGISFSILFYVLVRKFFKSSNLHLIKLESLTRFVLLFVGAFAAFSLGANNIANIMGVFVNSSQFSISIGNSTISSIHILLFIGGFAIAFGIFSYSKKVIKSIGGGILSMTPETAIVVLLSQALVLFIFSSKTLSTLFENLGLPAIPLVPVSSTQVVVSSILVIGLIKGNQTIHFKSVAKILYGWFLTPLLACAFTFFSLFFAKNVFGIELTQRHLTSSLLQTEKIQQVNMQIPYDSNSIVIPILLLVLIVVIIYFILSQIRNKKISIENEHRLIEQMHYTELQKALSEIEVSTVQLENTNLATRLEEKKNELVTQSLNIGEQRQYLEQIYNSIQQAVNLDNIDEINKILKEQLLLLKQKMSFTGEVDKIL